MEIFKLTSVLKDKRLRTKVIGAMRNGGIFVYPTDTIYGIGCNAENAESVEKIRRVKGREEDKQFSVIAPGKEWIWKNAKLSAVNKELADRMLPGPYTIIANASGSAPRPVVSSERTIGIRLPRHPFSEIVEEAGVPVVTTSVNLSSENPASTIAEVPNDIKTLIDIAIDAGKIEGQASRIFDFRTDDIKTVRRR
jgi:tRNA threonylcarbamoyl adenosine modification protein (Sua5/YciO/YrdC/YwlC family)